MNGVFYVSLKEIHKKFERRYADILIEVSPKIEGPPNSRLIGFFGMEKNGDLATGGAIPVFRTLDGKLKQVMSPGDVLLDVGPGMASLVGY